MPASFGFLSTYPPTQCGLATFTAALHTHLVAAGHHAGVVRVIDQAESSADATVVAQMVHGQPDAASLTAATLNRFDVVVVQHEFGIFAGPDGDSVVDVLERLVVPTIVVLHTVLVDPTVHQREVLEAVARSADALVTMTATAQQRLIDHYDIDHSKIVVIPHGAPDVRRPHPRRPGDRPVILTWGLLGPGKGIERVIDALPSFRDLAPMPHYVVLGDTHPRVLEREGDRYRDALVARAERLGVGRHGDVPVRLPRCRVPRRGRRDRRCGGPAVRLPGAGHLRRAHRSRGRAATGGRDRVRPRRRAPRFRCGPRGRSRRSRCDAGGDSPGAVRAGGGSGHDVAGVIPRARSALVRRCRSLRRARQANWSAPTRPPWHDHPPARRTDTFSVSAMTSGSSSTPNDRSRAATTATASTTWRAPSMVVSREPDPSPAVRAVIDQVPGLRGERAGARRSLSQPSRTRSPLAGPARRRGLLGTGAVGPWHRRRPRIRPRDPSPGGREVRPQRPPTLPVPPGHGLRRARRRRDPRSHPRRPACPGAAGRGAARDRPSRRGRRRGRGPSRAWRTRTRRCPKRSSPPVSTSATSGRSTTGCTCWAGSSRSRPATITSRSPPPAAGRSATSARASTSSRSRWPPWPTPAPARCASPATVAG